jgi:hypothetical protein
MNQKFLYACMHVRADVHVCTMYACVRVWVDMAIEEDRRQQMHVHARMHVCVSVGMHAYVHMYVVMYLCTHMQWHDRQGAHICNGPQGV